MEKEGINLRNDPFALEKLKVAAEGAKKTLSVEDQVEIRIPDVVSAPDGSSSLSIERTLTSEEFATLVNDLVQRSFKVCDEALQEAGVIARDLDGVILVGGPTRLPVVRNAVRDYFQRDPKADVDPDQVVAMGAAIHAATLVDAEREAFLLDVTPLSLRIGVAGGMAETVIERNTPVPIEQTRAFTTFQDDQESVKIRVYQGESREAKDNELLGQFEFSGFRKAPRGEITIDVTFEINADGIVDVTARDRETNRTASTRITLSSGLSEGEIQNIIEENRTDRVTSDVAEDAEVLGSVELVSTPAETVPQTREALEPEKPARPAAHEAPTDEMRAYDDDLEDELELLPEDETGEPLELAGNGDVTAVSDPTELMETSDELALDESDASLADTQPDDELFGTPGTDLSGMETDDGAEKA
jgi:molecular chaperone DnaK (HSP70)